MALTKSISKTRVHGVWGSAKTYWLADALKRQDRPVCVICVGRHEAEDWLANVNAILSSPREIEGHNPNLKGQIGLCPSISPLILEGWELPLASARPSLENAAERSLVLERLLSGGKTGVIIATLSGALQRLLPLERYAAMRMELKKGEQRDRNDLMRALVHAGYERASVVEHKGDFAVHGGILDVYPVASANPLRLEFVGDALESLRFFDTISQRSIGHADRAVIHAANEWKLLGETANGTSLTDILSQDTLIVLDEPLELKAMDERTKAQDGLMPMPRREFGEFLECAGKFDIACLTALPQTLPGWENTKQIEIQSRPVELGLPPAVIASMKQWTEQDFAVSLVFQNEGEETRFAEWAKEAGLDAPWLKKVKKLRGDMDQGFVSETFRVAYLTDRDIFGRHKTRRSLARYHGASPLGEFVEWEHGDYVVHQRHGIGRYRGVQKIAKDGETAEYISIEYAEGAKLHVPLDQAYLVQKYMGVGDRPVTLDKLGSKKWEATKARVLAATLKIAKDLLEVQAARKSLQGIPYAKDTTWQREFEAAFPYEETPDQIVTIEDVKKDMEKAQPMDRLICGDVGYGKTEVAIRAAFKAVMDHRQVAVLVPTTLLAQQHYVTFSQRMADYPLRVEMLSRFRHPSQVRKILLDLVEGKIDIVIGTHKLLQPDVAFKDLGLVIIDEEQRFGVKHKEAFKRLRKLVDVLTLTATPIPRTLYLSLLGTKEMSTINTPPQDRLPVQTMLAEHGEDVIRRAIRYELAREGQVFFVHNRVRTIDKVREMVQKLVPEARVASAHGQMDEDGLSAIMSDFVAGRIDVLVTTTIIESGLDIPNANTLIVDRADMFGLSELYQLRGRVGRFKNKAYAYFLLPKDKVLLDAAKKRLKAIHDFTALGSGFKIAMRDLEIRGAGNILGHQQHGHIAAVGFDLYCRLLKQNVARLKAQPLSSDQEVTVKIGEQPLIPSDYVASEAMRMDLYRRISSAAEEGQVQALDEEMRDRFGTLPPGVRLYLDIARVRILARSKGVFFLERKDGKWLIRRFGETVASDGRLPRSNAKSGREALAEAKNILSKLPDASTIRDWQNAILPLQKEPA